MTIDGSSLPQTQDERRTQMGLIPDDLKYRKFTFAEKFTMVLLIAIVSLAIWGGYKAVLWLADKF